MISCKSKHSKKNACAWRKRAMMCNKNWFWALQKNIVVYWLSYKPCFKFWCAEEGLLKVKSISLRRKLKNTRHTCPLPSFFFFLSMLTLPFQQSCLSNPLLALIDKLYLTNARAMFVAQVKGNAIRLPQGQLISQPPWTRQATSVPCWSISSLFFLSLRFCSCISAFLGPLNAIASPSGQCLPSLLSSMSFILYLCLSVSIQFIAELAY